MTKCKVVKDQVVLYEDNVMYVESVSSTRSQAIKQVKQFLDSRQSIMSTNDIEFVSEDYDKCYIHLVSQEERDNISQHAPIIVAIDDYFLTHDREQVIKHLQEIIEYQTSNDIQVYQEHIDTLSTLLK